jgi:hypothetical protein
MGSKVFQKYSADFFALLILVFGLLWFAQEMVWDDKVPFFRDLGTYFYPLRYSLADALRSYQLPLWERHAAMGFPLLADFQSGSFYPPHLIFLVFPFFSAIRALFLFHYLVALSGTYVLCRLWRYPRDVAVLGAVLFTLGGTMISLTNLLNHFQTAVWLPWSVVVWERFLRDKSWGNFVRFSVVLLLQLLAGSPEMYVLSMCLLLCDALVLECVEQRHQYGRAISLLVAANFLVALLGMAQLLPTIELLGESRRQEPIPYLEAANWSLNPFNLVNLFFLDKEVSTKMQPGAQPFFGVGIPFFISYYMGAVSLFGASLWFVFSSAKEKLFLTGLVFLSLALAFGAFTPVYPFLYRHTPLLGMLRYPEKFFFFTHALLLLMVLRGIARFQSSDAEHSNRALILLAFVSSLIVVTYVFLRFNPDLLLDFVTRSTGLPMPPQLNVGNTASVLVNVERQIGLWCGLLLLLFAGKKGYMRRPLASGLLLAAVFIDLSWAHESYQYLLKPNVVEQGPRILAAPDREPNRVFYYPQGQSLHPSYFVIRRQPTMREVYAILFANLLPNAGIIYGFDYMQDINALGKDAYTKFLKFAHMIEPERRFRLLGALNVKYVVSFHSIDAPGITAVRHFPEHPSWLYQINQSVPRVYVVPKATVEKDPNNILTRLSTADFDSLREVILDRPHQLPTSAEGRFFSHASIVEYTNRQVTIRTSLSDSGVLVLADSFYPGWRAYVNGSEKQILRANFFFRGVPLPSGEHTVVFRYEPRSFLVGALISLLTLLAIVVVTAWLCLDRCRELSHPFIAVLR